MKRILQRLISAGTLCDMAVIVLLASLLAKPCSAKRTVLTVYLRLCCINHPKMRLFVYEQSMSTLHD